MHNISQFKVTTVIVCCLLVHCSFSTSFNHQLSALSYFVSHVCLSSSSDLDPQETLLHFSARRGLFRVTNFLLQQPGARVALRVANRQGYTPSAIAALRGHECLHELLKQ